MRVERRDRVQIGRDHVVELLGLGGIELDCIFGLALGDGRDRLGRLERERGRGRASGGARGRVLARAGLGCGDRRSGTQIEAWFSHGVSIA